ncbi:MAG: hypothetical protein A2504_17040 [Bdellovibrionales bacterium RIFOXYD12_FULL_39_22]|nr:MAG: hypothetical protein A2385_17865 [Bdellovibrionales bacterium RIFOXYB1_FULL_39_21]OFZ44040.1 MAG: hypothetical protein A2485_15000 [Bdellovibrionales bacterium RIFOXYC12_FULL_39_17]OFZ48293.1 MAG: hypothetical protein A2404_08730 [Bdellovibrionales bacterium RIFOXYC1_FULL_39_130]OFZ76621.1 MAG: hypothetical protein A2560_17810 [Bdellovibrionales bacterium RIFOXYD1_FULL_39_84]OFZ95542.1 MAG: hypothetical protein A2504_17040 [Bdellovibrionales bacterium RIFOXYD12_FULL_39_22]
MDRITFPVVETKEHRLTCKNGVKSFFYELTPPDLYQMSRNETEAFYNGIAEYLNNLDENCFYKFYGLGKRNYLCTNKEVDQGPRMVGMGPSDRPLQTFFGAIDIYSDVAIMDNYLCYNGKYRRILSVAEFASGSIGDGFMPFGVDYVLSVRRIGKEKSLKQMEKIRTSHLGNFFKAKRDIESEGAYQQAENLIGDLTVGSESLFEMELYFIVTGLSLEELNQKSDELIDVMKSRGVKLFVEGHSIKAMKSGLGTIFSELIPGVTPSFKFRPHTDKTSHLKFLLPLQRSHLMDSGVEFSDTTDEKIFYDPFAPELPNRNMLVTGSSGGGKSVFVNKIIHALIAKHPTVILDKGGSFRRLTLYHGGVSLDGSFNPLQFKDPLYLMELILSVVDKEKFGKLERGKLLRAIKSVLDSNNAIDDFSQFLRQLESHLPGISLYFEIVGGLFVEKKIPAVSILYVDIDQYPKEAIAPIIIFILEYFKNIESKEKILVFDESWSFLKEHADYIDECFRTFRKTGALPIAISQGLNDFAGSGGKLYSSITNNSFIKVFFPQEKIDDPEVTDFDHEMIKTLHFEKGSFSECYLKSADNKIRKVLRIYLSPLELELFHTEAGEDSKFFDFFNKHRPFLDSNQEAINAYVRLKHANF